MSALSANAFNNLNLASIAFSLLNAMLARKAGNAGTERERDKERERERERESVCVCERESFDLENVMPVVHEN
jgi:hypothetical protein